jgi:hypothetical protein
VLVRFRTWSLEHPRHGLERMKVAGSSELEDQFFGDSPLYPRGGGLILESFGVVES